MEHFIHIFLHYCAEIAPALAIGFLISGVVHELIPEDMVLKYLGSPGIKPILYSTLVGTILPVCCWGSLPIAISFYKKGARLGPILAFLTATPATSISAILVTYSLLGPIFAAYAFFAVIIMGITAGLVGNAIRYEEKRYEAPAPCPHCTAGGKEHEGDHKKNNLFKRVKSVFRYAYIELPKEIGLELIAGVLLATTVAAFIPIGKIIKLYLGGWLGYLFSIVFGILTYLCATASIPLVDSLIKQGMNIGAAMTLILIGPVTSYGTILVIRKEYGVRVLGAFILSLIISTLILGAGFQIIKGAVF